jgi:hypothetical protein
MSNVLNGSTASILSLSKSWLELGNEAIESSTTTLCVGGSTSSKRGCTLDEAMRELELARLHVMFTRETEGVLGNVTCKGSFVPCVAHCTSDHPMNLNSNCVSGNLDCVLFLLRMQVAIPLERSDSRYAWHCGRDR